MENKYDLTEIFKLFPNIKKNINFYKKHNKDLNEIIQIYLYTKDLIDNFVGLKEYFLNHDIEENLELPYAVISHFAGLYFSSEEKIQKKIEYEVHNFTLKNFNINEMRYLLLAGFFESYAFDSKEKYDIFINRLPDDSRIILKKYLEY